MAKATWEVIAALRSTAERLAKSADYQWGHMGSCNCGFLAQEVTHLKKDEIHKRAMQRYGDWNEQLNDYCPSSGLLMDNLISDLLSFGFDISDLKNLERLSDPAILQSIPPETRNLRHNNKADVILYFHQWATVLEDEMSDGSVDVWEFEVLEA